MFVFLLSILFSEQQQNRNCVVRQTPTCTSKTFSLVIWFQEALRKALQAATFSFRKTCKGLHTSLRFQIFDQLLPWMDGNISVFIFCLPYTCLTSLCGHTVLQINLQLISFSCNNLNFYLGLHPHTRFSPQNLPDIPKQGTFYQHNLMQIIIPCIPE